MFRTRQTDNKNDAIKPTRTKLAEPTSYFPLQLSFFYYYSIHRCVCAALVRVESFYLLESVVYGMLYMYSYLYVSVSMFICVVFHENSNWKEREWVSANNIIIIIIIVAFHFGKLTPTCVRVCMYYSIRLNCFSMFARSQPFTGKPRNRIDTNCRVHPYLVFSNYQTKIRVSVFSVFYLLFFSSFLVSQSVAVADDG